MSFLDNESAEVRFFSGHVEHARARHLDTKVDIGPRPILALSTHMRPMTIHTHALTDKIELSHTDRSLWYKDLPYTSAVRLPHDPEEELVKGPTPPVETGETVIGERAAARAAARLHHYRPHGKVETYVPRGPFSGKTFGTLVTLPFAPEVLVVYDNIPDDDSAF